MTDAATLAPVGVDALIARQEIADAMHRYARGVDRGDWDLVRSAYHPDAFDDHVEFRGGVDALVAWLDERFAGADNSSHFLGSSLVEFADAGTALVETYFISSRLRAPGAHDARAEQGDAVCRQSWGRYVDRFERRDGAWKVADRRVVLESRFTAIAIGGLRGDEDYWGRRDGDDAVFALGRALGIR